MSRDAAAHLISEAIEEIETKDAKKGSHAYHLSEYGYGSGEGLTASWGFSNYTEKDFIRLLSKACRKADIVIGINIEKLLAAIDKKIEEVIG